MFNQTFCVTFIYDEDFGFITQVVFKGLDHKGIPNLDFYVDISYDADMKPMIEEAEDDITVTLSEQGMYDDPEYHINFVYVDNSGYARVYTNEHFDILEDWVE